MDTSNRTQGLVLVVDDEPDVLATLEEMLQGFLVYKAQDFETAKQYLMAFTYDAVILDIMGVNGFELLRISVLRGFPTIMFTAHALTPEAIKTSIKLGAVAYLPKTEISNLPLLLKEVINNPKAPLWKKVFERFLKAIDKDYGDDWREKDVFLKEFQARLKEGG